MRKILCKKSAKSCRSFGFFELRVFITNYLGKNLRLDWHAVRVRRTCTEYENG